MENSNIHRNRMQNIRVSTERYKYAFGCVNLCNQYLLCASAQSIYYGDSTKKHSCCSLASLNLTGLGRERFSA